MIALLAARPLRRRSLSTLKVGKNLWLTGIAYVLSVDSIETSPGRQSNFHFRKL